MSFKVGDRVEWKGHEAIGIITSFGIDFATVKFDDMPYDMAVKFDELKLHNPPLTPKDLAEMDGAKVWAVDGQPQTGCKIQSEWRTVNFGDKKVISDSGQYWAIGSPYAKFYRYKPKEPAYQCEHWTKDAYMSFIEHRSPTFVIKFDLEEKKVNEMPELKTGMVVEYDYGGRYVVMKDTEFGDIFAATGGGFNNMHDTRKIVRVFKHKERQRLLSVKTEHLELIWEHKRKVFTAAEASAKLSELLGEDVEITGRDE